MGSLGVSYQQADFDTIQGESLDAGILVYEERWVFPDGGEIYSQYLGVFDTGTSVALVGGVASGFIDAAGVDQRIDELNMPFNPNVPRSREVTVSTAGLGEFGTVALTRGAFGVKYNLGNGFLLVGSALFRLSENGVQAKFAPIFGLERAWRR